MSNTYFSWIEDEKLFEAINYVYEQYRQALQDKDLNSFINNVIDPFSLLFDTYLTQKPIEQWIKEEIDRQAQKTLSNAIGDFHQKILGNCSGWEDLGRNHDTGLDVKKSDDTIFAEIKNKFNTTNSGSGKSVMDKIKDVQKLYPNATVYFVEIIPNQRTHSDSRKISGDEFYELVTGKEDALRKLFEKLPNIIDKFISDNQFDYLEPNYCKSSEKNIVITDLKSVLNDLKYLDVYRDFFYRAYNINGYVKKRWLLKNEIIDEIFKEFGVNNARELKKQENFEKYKEKYNTITKNSDFTTWKKFYQDVFNGKLPCLLYISDNEN